MHSLFANAFTPTTHQVARVKLRKASNSIEVWSPSAQNRLDSPMRYLKAL